MERIGGGEGKASCLVFAFDMDQMGGPHMTSALTDATNLHSVSWPSKPC